MHFSGSGPCRQGGEGSILRRRLPPGNSPGDRGYFMSPGPGFPDPAPEKRSSYSCYFGLSGYRMSKSRGEKISSIPRAVNTPYLTSKAGEFGQTEPYKSIFSARTEKKRFTGIYGVRENRKLRIGAQKTRPGIPQYSRGC